MAWYTSPGGTTCVAAYNAVGASSLANSYINLANPGTYDAAPGVAPTWAYGTGWTFNGTTQYLTTGVVPASDQTWSALIRFSGGAQNTKYIFGAVTSGSTRFFGFNTNYTDNKVYYYNGSFLGINTGINSGVLGVAGNKGYRNGSAESGTIPAGSGTITGGALIGAVNVGATPSFLWPGNVQALAIYSGTLSASDVATITTAMNALPVAGLLASMLQHAAMGWR